MGLCQTLFFVTYYLWEKNVSVFVICIILLEGVKFKYLLITKQDSNVVLTYLS